MNQRLVFCAEAEYAFNLGKPIITLSLEADFHPDDWLSLVCEGRDCYNFSGHDPRRFEWQPLLAQLRQLIPTATQSSRKYHNVYQ